ncbi:Xylose isomerase-like TIM barrel [Caprobacter fermentans]|uniref:Xylose isomerase-like TIM barrel n=1 Tax=Caproicibacter fermentans TaxID=2576756 RepID=A0A6N8HW25_9FIRM|nr:sugar phosphate isomerase/epimerase family protein [Caproicibacter fermentans]MVB09932.1 Xylose isomerase-like TIM barrel [Caproicibacter fermentans]
MKLSVSNIAWKAEQDEEVYSEMSRLGFTGLEIAPTRILTMPVYEKAGEAALFAQNLQTRRGLRIVSMQSIWFGRTENLFGPRQERETLMDYTRGAIDFASACGCMNLVFGCPRNRVMQSAGQYPLAVAFFQETADYALKNGTVISLEANPAVYGTNFINTTLEAAELVERVNSPGFRLNLDFGTMLENHEEPEAVAYVLPLVHHVHISEPGLGPVHSRPEHAELMRLLRRSGYAGYVSLEMKNPGNLQTVFQSMNLLQNVFG